LLELNYFSFLSLDGLGFPPINKYSVIVSSADERVHTTNVFVSTPHVFFPPMTFAETQTTHKSSITSCMIQHWTLSQFIFLIFLFILFMLQLIMLDHFSPVLSISNFFRSCKQVKCVFAKALGRESAELRCI